MDLTMKIFFFTSKSLKRQITDCISESLTDSDLESNALTLPLISTIKFDELHSTKTT